MGNFLQECFPVGKSQFDKTDTVCKQQFWQAFFKKKSFGFQFQEVLLFLFLSTMLQHIVYIKTINLSSVPNFAFIDIHLDCKCPFPSELETLKIFCLPSHPDWKDIWKHGIYHRMESWIPLQLQLSQVTGAPRLLSARTRDQAVEKPFQERGRTPCCLRNVKADLTKPWRICSWGQFGIGRRVDGLP